MKIIVIRWNVFLISIIHRKYLKKAVGKRPASLEYVLISYKTRDICEIAVEYNPYKLKCVPDQYKAHEMCDKQLERVLGY